MRQGDSTKVSGKAEDYRIEADRLLGEYDDLEVDAGIMLEALAAIAAGRPNKRFDPWAKELARDALANVSERVKGLRPE